MKTLKLYSLIILAGLFSTRMYAQELSASTYLEKTHISPKVGTTVGVQFASDIEVGGFYQQSADPVEREYGRPLTEEREFYGVFFAYPVIGNDNANVKMNVRTGVSNGENFVITPSLYANYTPFRNITISSGVGTRALRPTLLASLKINL